jgi:protein-tyrosine phosphatase
MAKTGASAKVSIGRLVNLMPSILFVCTGNIFRSLTAEYALRTMRDPRSPIRVSSAGTVAIPQAMHPDVRAYLVQRGIDPSQHHQRRVSAELLHATDLVIAMSTDHQAFLADTFQYRAPLFHEVCHGRVKPLLDIWEAIPAWESDRDAARRYAFQVMECIWASIPCLLQNLGTYLTVEWAEEGVFASRCTCVDADERLQHPRVAIPIQRCRREPLFCRMPSNA